MKHKMESNCWEKYQQPKTCRWHQLYGGKQRKTKESLRESERGAIKGALKLNIQIIRIMASGPISSVQFSHSVVSDYLWCHGLQNVRLPCPSQTPGACSNSCSLSQWCHPTISSCVSSPLPPSFNLSQDQVLFQWVSSCFKWPKYWTFGFSISPSNEYSGMISFRKYWFNFLAFQGSLKSLLQHHSSKASILWCSAFFRIQLSHPYMTTGKTIALTRWTFVGKVTSLLFHILSKLVIAFLPISKIC